MARDTLSQMKARKTRSVRPAGTAWPSVKNGPVFRKDPDVVAPLVGPTHPSQQSQGTKRGWTQVLPERVLPPREDPAKAGMGLLGREPEKAGLSLKFARGGIPGIYRPWGSRPEGPAAKRPRQDLGLSFQADAAEGAERPKGASPAQSGSGVQWGGLAAGPSPVEMPPTPAFVRKDPGVLSFRVRGFGEAHKGPAILRQRTRDGAQPYLANLQVIDAPASQDGVWERGGKFAVGWGLC